MKAKHVAAAAAYLCLGVPASYGTEVFTEPFAYTAGQTLLGNSPEPGRQWNSAAQATADDLVVNASSLLPSGAYALPPEMLPATGGSVSYGGQSRTYRIDTGQLTSGTVYWSMVVRVDELTAANVNGGIVAGFSSSVGDGGSNPTGIHSTLFAKPGSSGNYLLGIGRNANENNAGYTGDIALGTAVFLVGSYEFVPGATNDVARLWVNPDPSTFGGPNPPATTATNVANTSAEASASGIQSFLLYQRGTSSALTAEGGITADELRVGTSWGDVAIPEPACSALLALAGIGFSRRRRRPV